MVKLPCAKSARNEGLFTRRYLCRHLPTTQVWEEDDKEAQEAWEELQKIYDREKESLPDRQNQEKALQKHFVEDIFEEVLGFEIDPERTSDVGQGSPDIALFENVEDRNASVADEEPYKLALALAEVKGWNVRLAEYKKGGGREYAKENPTAQIMRYLFNNQPAWGILTNGRQWRLLHQQKSSNKDKYFEVDVKELVENGSYEDFKFFYFLFRRDAYTGEEGRRFVDKVLTESNRRAREIGEDLEDNVYQALLWLAKGLVDVNTNELNAKEDIDRIHDECLIFLYRLLFLFYVNDRDVMEDPANQGHRTLSFPALVQDIIDDIENKDVDEYSVSYWNRLKEIFTMVNKGSEAQGIPREDLFVPPYNGQLFSAEEHEFLEDNKIRDRFIAKVIDLLARHEDGKQVDYADLSVRHLGGVYEGLLEYNLRYADEKMVVKDGKWKKLEDTDISFKEKDEENRAEEGTYYLETDEQERNATGSYYTPDYIVNYIVENTVEPIIDERVDEDVSDEENREALLDINILDPAMGSGHFLVAAVDKIASHLMEFTEKKEPQEVKRQVARRCIYGVDLNPLATELAKVSLWLNTISADKPLSFLDHHLKTGNSLVGADIFDLDSYPGKEEKMEDAPSPGQTTLVDKFGGDDDEAEIQENIKQLLNMYQRIMEQQEEAPDDIHEQADIYAEFQDNKFRKRFDALADVYTSYYFNFDFIDFEFDEEDWKSLLKAFQPGSDEWKEMIRKSWVSRASDSIEDGKESGSAKKQFFHWKLEFPEVYFDIESGKQKDNSGFDAVIGNPPYINANKLNQITTTEKKLWKDKFSSSSGAYDIYILFLEQSLRQCREDGRVGLIVPNKHLSAPYATAYREYVIDNHCLYRVGDASQVDVFDEASVYPVITFLKSGISQQDIDEIRVDAPETEEEFNDLPHYSYRPDRLNSLSDNLWGPLLLYPRENKVFWSAISSTEDLVEQATVQASSTTSEAEAFTEAIYDGEPTENAKKFIKTGGIDRFYASWANESVRHQGKEYENPVLDVSHDVVTELREGQYRSPKIIFAKISSRLEAFVDKDGEYATVDTNLCYDPERDISYFGSIINSKLMQFFYKGLFGALRMSGGDFQFQSPQLKRLPVPRFEHLDANDVDKSLLNKINEMVPDGDISKTEDALVGSANLITEFKTKYNELNLNILDYIRLEEEPNGDKLSEIGMPVSNVSEGILALKTDSYDAIKVEDVVFSEKGNSLILSAKIRYKPENEEEYETDSWGYTQTEPVPALKFTGLSTNKKRMIQELVPAIVDEGGGFCNFYEDAAKTISPLERLEAVTLPKLDDVEDGLQKYLDVKERAEELDRKIEETDELIDEIVYDLYGLSDEEIEVVEEAVE